jgi:hypothetical protein
MLCGKIYLRFNLGGLNAIVCGVCMFGVYVFEDLWFWTSNLKFKKWKFKITVGGRGDIAKPRSLWAGERGRVKLEVLNFEVLNLCIYTLYICTVYIKLDGCGLDL